MTSPLSPEQINAYLVQIGQTLNALPPGPQRGEKTPAELLEMQTLNASLIEDNRQVLQKAQIHYTVPANWILGGPQGLANRERISTALRNTLATLEVERRTSGHVRKNWVLENHQVALEAEAKLKVKDRLLSPADVQKVMNIVSGPAIRPGIHALTFSYREHTLEFAGAFVLTSAQTPITTLTAEAGEVLLFTPSRGLEAFTSLASLDATLRERMGRADWRQELLQHLPRRFQHLRTASIWPLIPSPIDSLPLNEHTYNALLEKQRQDIDFALGLNGNPAPTRVAQMRAELDRVACCTLPDLTARLELRAQQVLDKLLREAAPDWYRSAPEAQRQTLAEHLQTYDDARQTLLACLGPAASPEATAQIQLLERLDQELDIQELIPELLHINTERPLMSGGSYAQQTTLLQLAVRGLHVGDEQPGSTFLTHTTLTYAQQPLPPAFKAITPEYLAHLIGTLQSSQNFAIEQQQALSSAPVEQAMQHMLDTRLQALAYSARLQNHITAHDFELFDSLRDGPSDTIKACCVALHEAPLKDLWVLRQTDAKGAVKRLLLCAPQAPRAEQFMGFDSERALKAHILGWSQEAALSHPSTMKTYLLGQLVSRARLTYSAMLAAVGFKPASEEYRMITLRPPTTYQACLQEMSSTLLSMQTDEYQYRMPSWLARAPAADRQRLADLREAAAGAALSYAASPGSPPQFPDFDSYLHRAAHTALNTLLGNPTPAVDPDRIGVLTPRERVSYTTLYRNGYDNSPGFINPDASTTAEFKGPTGVDLSRLTAEKVSNSIKGTWIGDRYIAEVEKTLLNPQAAHYAWYRNQALEISQLRMKADALSGCLQGHITRADLAWLEKAINTLGDNSEPVRSLYRLYPLQIKGQVIDGCYLFHHASDLPLLYTPDAPDEIAFRPQREFNERLKNLNGMDTYYCKRVASLERLAFGPAIKALVANLPAQLKGVYSKPVFDEVPRTALPLKNLRYHFYDKRLRHLLDEVKSTTTGRLDMIMGLVTLIGELTIAVLTAPFPPLSLALGALLVFKDSMLALHAYQRGETGAALGHYIGALLNAGGALLTDLRPVLLSASKVASKPLRHIARLPVEQRAMALVEQVQPQPPVLRGMQPVAFGGDALWAQPAPDAIGRFLLFRYDAASEQLLSTGKLVNKNTQGQWVRSGIAGGAPKYEALETPYELPEKFRKDVAGVLLPEDRTQMFLLAADIDSTMNANTVWGMRQALHPALEWHLKQAKQLARDADTFFANLPPLVKRADTLSVAENIDLGQLFRQLLDDAQSLVIGESNFSIASKQLLIDNMALLRELNVKTLYIEHLWRDVHHLQTHSRFAKGPSKQAKKHLKAIDYANFRDPEGQYGYWKLVEAAIAHRIEVKSLNASTCYDLENVLGLVDSRPAIARPASQINYYSHTVINADLEKTPGERWIALVDHKRMSTYRGIPGLADLQKTIALRVDDAFGQPTRVINDVAGNIPGDPLAKGDLKLSLRTSDQVLEPSPPPLTSEPPLPATHFDDFDLPEMHLGLYQREMTLPVGLRETIFNTAYPELAGARQAAQKSFDMTRRKLLADARLFFDTQPLPSRVSVPAIEESIEEALLIDRLLESAEGLVIGESHGATSSKAFLSNHMEHLTGQPKVKTLYLEQLTTELHQADLDIAYGTGVLTDELWAYLHALDSGHGVPGGSPYSFASLVEVAVKHKVRIRALDCIATLRVDGMAAHRTQMFSYFATQVIRADQLQYGPHKWVALVGETHANIYRGVPGIAELNKGISVLLDDVPPGSGSGFLRQSPSVPALTPEQEWGLVRYDFKKSVEVAGAPLPLSMAPASARNLEQRLKNSGDYLIQRTSSGEMEIVHRDRHRALVHTPLRVDTGGHFVNRWSLDEMRFKTREQLIQFIETKKGMRQIH
ncbi:membrane-targeted effector domain-containing toxin [Pseudomonas sp. K2I15]|uniref:membrane-targeted effector domain-containing toxin n=1 Tax=unclassified Pseudomonas TaxID=196821 RepID=UPI000B4D9321|nr:membrane-targeted effector domain-containing toxin [Pseudomonas sp. K2I15]OWP72039.1 type III effector [Pseudomonas sp. K2I15]